MPFIDALQLADASAEMHLALQLMIASLSLPDWLQIVGAATGILGAYLLACNNRSSRFGYVAYVVSNLTWAGFGLLAGAYGLVVMQVVFFVTTVIGLKNWFPEIWGRIRNSHGSAMNRSGESVALVSFNAANDDTNVLDVVSRGRRAGSL